MTAIAIIDRLCIAPGYRLPVLLSVVLHGLLLALVLTLGSMLPDAVWAPPSSPITAQLMTLPARSAGGPNKASLSNTANKIKAKRAVNQSTTRQQANAKPATVQKKVTQSKQIAAEQARQAKRAAQRQAIQEELLRALTAEQQTAATEKPTAPTSQEEQEATDIAHYSAVLNTLVSQHWHRPPSARNGMTAVLQVNLSYRGSVLSIKLLTSSGNEAFDHSVIQAVKAAAPFPELQQLDRRRFDQAFRRFNLRFRPEDLVR